MSLLMHILFLILIMALSWRGGLSTCVLESDFGFTLNCQFKKSSIFRVRNLGGVKGYVGLGFSVGDELGFGQSLSNLEGNKRRSTNGRSSGLSAYLDEENSVSKKAEVGRTYQGLNSRYKSSQLSTIPPFKPIPPADGSLKPVAGYVVGPVLAVQMNGTRPVRNPTYSANSIPSFQALPVSVSKIPSTMKAPQAFKTALQQATNNFQLQSNLLQSNKLSHRTPLYQATGPQVVNVVQAQPQIERISSNSAPAPVKLLPTAIPVSNSVTTEKAKPLDNVSSGLMADTVKSLSQATNVSVEAIAAAINQKQQQLLKQQKTQKIIKSTTTTTTERSTGDVTRKYPLASPSRVMNAPREYYPVGYDKNFDDNFVSRVELPETSFYCGEQKHFPGLYADEDLGCMVFHVCAFTDDGLIMKSFLCPESTLFDQSILKCNWWFYVDCKSSKKLYDSNIPISKSYQLMKALAFFSTYNKQRKPVLALLLAPCVGVHPVIMLKSRTLRGYSSHARFEGLISLPIEGRLNAQSQSLGPKPSKMNQESGILPQEEEVARVDCCDECDPCPRKDVKSSSIAIKAAQEAKEAQEAQQVAGAQAARQVKAQLAERAYQAARAAEAAQAGKQAMVDQLEHEVREAQAVVQEEAASCQQTQANLQIALMAAAQAAHLLKALTTSLQISQSNLANSQQAADGAQQELAEKAALVDAARCRVEALLRELCVARQDLYAIKQAAYRAQCAARNAECNARRNRRRLQQQVAAAAVAKVMAPRKRRTNNVHNQVDKSEKNR